MGAPTHNQKNGVCSAGKVTVLIMILVLSLCLFRGLWRFAMPNRRNWEPVRDEIFSGVQLADSAFLERLRANGYTFSFPVDSLEKPFEKPTLILTGRQDATVGYQDAWDIIENYPRATFAVLDAAGHILQIEQERLFEELVCEWLERVKAEKRDPQ